jgi:DinB family protein
MTDDHVAANQRSLERLRQLVARLDEQALATSMGEGWTVATGLYHLGYWDRFVAARWHHAAEVGAASPVAFEKHVSELMNQALTPIWAALPPGPAGAVALEAAEACDALVASLSPESVADTHAVGRPKMVDRSHHRDQHLDQIERALAGRA